MDVLKLAGFFVSASGSAGEDTGRDIDSPVILSAMIDLAHSLGLRVIAESVETVEQATHLRSLGCDVGQGWFIAPPLPPVEMEALLDQRIAFEGDAGQGASVSRT